MRLRLRIGRAFACVLEKRSDVSITCHEHEDLERLAAIVRVSPDVFEKSGKRRRVVPEIERSPPSPPW